MKLRSMLLSNYSCVSCLLQGEEVFSEQCAFCFFKIMGKSDKLVFGSNGTFGFLTLALHLTCRCESALNLLISLSAFKYSPKHQTSFLCPINIFTDRKIVFVAINTLFIDICSQMVAVWSWNWTLQSTQHRVVASYRTGGLGLGLSHWGPLGQGAPVEGVSHKPVHLACKHTAATVSSHDSLSLSLSF